MTLKFSLDKPSTLLENTKIQVESAVKTYHTNNPCPMTKVQSAYMTSVALLVAIPKPKTHNLTQNDPFSPLLTHFVNQINQKDSSSSSLHTPTFCGRLRTRGSGSAACTGRLESPIRFTGYISSVCSFYDCSDGVRWLAYAIGG